MACIPPYLIEQCPTWQLQNPSKWTLTGHSRAGERTGFWISPLRISLDAGMVAKRTPRAVLVTHSHYDHTNALPQLVCNHESTDKRTPRPVVFPNTAKEPIHLLMAAVAALSDGKIDADVDVCKRQNYQPIAVDAGQVISIPGIRDVRVEVLPAYHRADSLGYGLSTVKIKLKAEFLSCTKEEIVAARKAKVVITEELVTPEIAFFADSTIENLTEHDEWKKYPVVVVECTGYPSHHSIDHIRSRSHTHLNELENVMEQYKDKHWVLIHSSMGISEAELHDEELRLRNNGLIIDIVRDSHL